MLQVETLLRSHDAHARMLGAQLLGAFASVQVRRSALPLVPASPTGRVCAHVA